jgi:glycerol-3-phosphate O-acyltransferase
VSTLLNATAKQVAVDQNLLNPGVADIDARRAACTELRAILGDLDKIEETAQKQLVERELRHIDAD